MRSRMLQATTAVALLVGWLLTTEALHAAFPRPEGYVNDFADLVKAEDEAYLENFLQTLERDTSAEVVVATVPSLDGMSIEEYASRLFAEWGIGKAREDNGLLVLVAPRQREVRIEVGYGLEPLITDGLAGEIIRNEILPEFKAGNYPRGIGRGVNRVSQIVRGAPGAANVPAAPRDDENGPPPALLLIGFLALFVATGAFVVGLSIRTKTYGPLFAAAWLGGIPFLTAVVAYPTFLSFAVLVPIALGMALMGYRMGRSPSWVRSVRSGATTDGDEPSRWVMGGSSGSWSSGSSNDSGSSGADFGGGSSGGGGATGRW